MGQGNIKYRKVKRTPQTGENAGKELWYATVVTDREMNFEEFVDHISSHNSPYSRGTVHGVMMDMLDCLKELILDGKSVRLGDLGLFSIGMSSRGEVSRDKEYPPRFLPHKRYMTVVTVLFRRGYYDTLQK